MTWLYRSAQDRADDAERARAATAAAWAQGLARPRLSRPDGATIPGFGSMRGPVDPAFDPCGAPPIQAASSSEEGSEVL
jgi:hypothetical protein